MTDSTSDELTMAREPRRWSQSPILLGPNQPSGRPYRGGAGIARFRGIENTDPYTPEDFVASTTEVNSAGGIGLTVLDDGTLLRDAVAADPVGFLGEEHVRRFGAETMLLVKLLNTGERLFVHYHPDDAFARTRLLAPRGKTEAWIIVGVDEGVEGYANLGFRRPVTATEVEHWFQEQDVPDMLGAMNRVPLSAGDTLLVPAGMAHAIGEGITLVELQQPSDLSILLEYRGFRGIDGTGALLGLDLADAVHGLHRGATDRELLNVLSSTSPVDDDGTQPLLPEHAKPYFRGDRLHVSGTLPLDPEFSVLVVESGAGDLAWQGGTLPVAIGSTVLIPHGAGMVNLSGGLTALRARPPRPID